jgi:hypothetical protein
MICSPSVKASPVAVPPLDDKYLLEEILLRLPPRPSSLPCASLVCTRWHNILLDPDFLRRFRKHHQKPPLLGFFAVRLDSSTVFIPTLDAPDCIPATRFPLRQNLRYGGFNVRGCHHGLAILVNRGKLEAFVWDPLTGHDRNVPFPPRYCIYKYGLVKNAVVFCGDTEDGHVHGDCSLSPFKVAFLWDDWKEKRAICCLYDSESGVWGDIISVATSDKICDTRPGMIVGNLVYWLLDGGGILELNLETQSLGVIEKPTNVHFTGYQYFHILNHSGLGLAVLLKSSMCIQLWRRKSKNEGVVGWVLQKIIQLNQLLPVVSQKDRKKTCILGYDNNTNTMVLSTTIGASMVQLETLDLRNIPERSYATYYPYTNFYTTGNTLPIFTLINNIYCLLVLRIILL